MDDLSTKLQNVALNTLIELCHVRYDGPIRYQAAMTLLELTGIFEEPEDDEPDELDPEAEVLDLDDYRPEESPSAPQLAPPPEARSLEEVERRLAEQQVTGQREQAPPTSAGSGIGPAPRRGRRRR